MAWHNERGGQCRSKYSSVMSDPKNIMTPLFARLYSVYATIAAANLKGSHSLKFSVQTNQKKLARVVLKNMHVGEHTLQRRG